MNTVFGEKVAKTGSGSPITANLNKYEKDGLVYMIVKVLK
ncbi:hypothetical protein ACNGIO_02515 [Campylobacter jejuni]